MIRQKMNLMTPPISKVLLFLKQKILVLQDHINKSGDHLIVGVTNECFATLTYVYRYIVKDTNSKFNLNDIYNFLLTINHELVHILKLLNFSNGMKNSNTDNRKSLYDTCHCSKGQCISSICSRKCIILCSVDHNITRYYCKSNANLSVAEDKICDGIKDCPDGDDEAKCIG